MIAFGTSYSTRDAVLRDRVLPLVDYIELTPDSVASMRGGQAVISRDVLDELEDVAARARLIVHGVGLSIGSADGCNESYFRLLDTLFDRLPIAWHSEHLAYTSVDGNSLGTMLVLPRIEQSLDLVCPRIERIQRRYGVEFLLEHVVSLLPEIGDCDYSHAAFLNEIVRRTGCGLLLDVYNLECDAHNLGLDVAAFLDELDLAAVREIHIANGTIQRGLKLDVHSQTTAATTRALLNDVLTRAPNAEVVVFELLPEAIPVVGHDAIVAELELLGGRAA